MLAQRPADLKLYSSIKEVPVDWLWYPYIPYGKLTLLQGDPGGGKSTFMVNIISAVSRGGRLPDGTELTKPLHVIYQCSEDGAADTIKPRLVAAGANCENVAFLDEESETFTLNDEIIRCAIADFNAKLLVVDPFQAYLGDADISNITSIRRILKKLSLWAAAYDCAIVLIGHLNKKEGSKGLYRSLGSIDVVAAARSVLQVERDPEDTDVRVVTQIKNSLGPSDAVIRFEIRPQTGFSWISVDTVSMIEKKTEPPVFDTKMEKAAYLIKETLSRGDVPSNEMYEKLETEGISHRTAEDTRKSMGIRCYRKMKQWYWSIKPQEE